MSGPLATRATSLPSHVAHAYTQPHHRPLTSITMPTRTNEHPAILARRFLDHRKKQAIKRQAIIRDHDAMHKLPPPKILLAHLSATNKKSRKYRDAARVWAAQPALHTRGQLDVRFIIGTNASRMGLSRQKRELLEMETRAVGTDDFILLNAIDSMREPLGGGDAAEKTSEFWRSAATDRRYHWFCTAEQTTLVHHKRLAETLTFMTRSLGGRPAYVGNIHWRGWEAGHSYRTCGGGASKDAFTTATEMQQGWTEGKTDYPRCERASGPFPFMMDGVQCMNQPLVNLVAQDFAFLDFVSVARLRNDRALSGGAGADAPLWTDVSAGMGFNVFRAIVAQQGKFQLVVAPLPGHFYTPDEVERSRGAKYGLSFADEYWSMRAHYVERVFTEKERQLVANSWELRRNGTGLRMTCEPCSKQGPSKLLGNWGGGRISCHSYANRPDAAVAAAAEMERRDAEVKFCPVYPDKLFICCGFPWVLPQQRAMLLESIRLLIEEGGHAADRTKAIPMTTVMGRMRLMSEQYKKSNPKFRMPMGPAVEQLLEELKLRGDVRVYWRKAWKDGGDPPEKGGIIFGGLAACEKLRRKRQACVKLVEVQLAGKHVGHGPIFTMPSATNSNEASLVHNYRSETYLSNVGVNGYRFDKV